MTSKGRVATTVVMSGLFGGACLLALALPQKAAFMPLLIGVPGLLLCLAQLVIDLRATEPEPAPPPEPGADARTPKEAQTELQAFAWLFAFAGALLGFGFIIGGPILVAAFVRFSSGDRWRNALFAGAGTFLVMWGVFVWLLELSLFQGLILERLL
ncbi:Tripartite tricarboxylate transporter TctB family protein [Roseivivax jejudonensis]|uniref:Tripartite tricarboxylate transporter TctB family protein n=1 Tax=Roseivivax jejudonensis TaxID=1529041 RepID=A0A1X6ZZV3_9RHOB|nr:tripartite tricarboxylate transporter TctB family protein [Roseivivax jejudonensis]SLN64515.1 Tripartite tricarboxylate transporter TctB family protein [Roseivivax jejudonensis]